MSEILQNQTLEAEHLFCFRGKVTDQELEEVGRDMDMVIRKAGAKRVSFPITATYSMDNGKMDVELLLPVDRRMDDVKEYHYKEQLKIVNAVVARHNGNPNYLPQTCSELNQYIADKELMPITVGYSVPKRADASDIENSIIDVYVGISPNIL